MNVSVSKIEKMTGKPFFETLWDLEASGYEGEFFMPLKFDRYYGIHNAWLIDIRLQTFSINQTTAKNLLKDYCYVFDLYLNRLGSSLMIYYKDVSYLIGKLQ